MSAPSSPKPAEKPESASNAPAEQVVAAAPGGSEAVASAAPAAGSNGSVAPTPSGNATASSNTPAAPTSLYVGELDPTVSEAMLFEIFSMVGPVISIRVCRDAVTRRSLGYAYVNYLNSADAERALDGLNYSLIKNKPCRIMWSQRDPSLRRGGAGNVFIKNLDESIDNKALHDTFIAFGNVVSCKIALDENGKSKGYGFVHYETTEAAEEAIAGVNGMMLADKIVYVGHYVAKRERQAKIDEVKSKFTNLYVKNLPLDTTEAELTELFSKYGKVTSAVLNDSTVQVEGKELKFGFVNLENHEDAKKALEELHDSKFKDETLFVTRAQKKGEREEELKKSYEAQRYEKTLKFQGVNLYIKNLDDDMDEEKLTAEFQQFGTITSCKIMKDEKNNSRGFGFVCFAAPEEATKAVTEMNGKMIGSKPLYVTVAQRKDVRKSQLEAQAATRNQVRNQQMLVAGIPPYGGAMPPQPMYYGQPGAFPPQGRGGPMMYPQGGPGGMRGMQMPRYAPPGQMPMGPYGQPMYPGGYPQGMPGQMGRGGPMNGRGGGPMGGMPGRQGQMPNGVGAMGAQPGGPQAGMRGAMPNAPAGARGAPPAARPGGYRGNAAAPRAAEQSQPSLTAAALANATPAQQKQILGETIYPKIHATQPDLAGKITGMLLEMDNSELLVLLEDDSALDVKVQEAMTVLEEYSKKEAEGAGGEAATAEA